MVISCIKTDIYWGPSDQTIQSTVRTSIGWFIHRSPINHNISYLSDKMRLTAGFLILLPLLCTVPVQGQRGFFSG